MSCGRKKEQISVATVPVSDRDVKTPLTAPWRHRDRAGRGLADDARPKPALYDHILIAD